MTGTVEWWQKNVWSRISKDPPRQEPNSGRREHTGTMCRHTNHKAMLQTMFMNIVLSGGTLFDRKVYEEDIKVLGGKR